MITRFKRLLHQQTNAAHNKKTKNPRREQNDRSAVNIACKRFFVCQETNSQLASNLSTKIYFALSLNFRVFLLLQL